MITACRNKYDAITLYEDIVNMDRTERRSSIIAVKDANRYLLYRDLGWGCDFFLIMQPQAVLMRMFVS